MASSYSLNKPLSFNGEGYSLWKNKMKFFREGIYRGIQKVVKEGQFVPTHEVDGL